MVDTRDEQRRLLHGHQPALGGERALPVVAPLDGVSILDLTRLLPGGVCTLLLADLGASVVKVEEPQRGDYFRLQPPFQEGVSTIHLLLNRDKRSLALNLKQPEGRRILLQLAAGADVLIESFRPGVMDNLDLGCEELCGINPCLIYCSLSGFGQDSPLRTRPGHDLDYTAMGGLLALSTENNPPAPFGVPVADYVSAWAAALAIVTSLLARKQSGVGRYLDLSLADCAFACGHLSVAQQLGGVPPERDKAPFWGGAACYRTYRTADDRYVTVSNYEDKFWENFCRALSRPDLAARQYATGAEQEEVVKFLEETMRTRTLKEWMAFFAEHDCCGTAVNNVAEALHEPQFWERGSLFWGAHPQAGRVLLMSSPLGGLEHSEGRPAPALGQHTSEILHSLGYEQEGIEALAAKGTVRLGG
jgi:crotonobetainyl-CoA:carnitine CoA-transferase CaiB-like acyl-CoA transferase